MALNDHQFSTWSTNNTQPAQTTTRETIRPLHIHQTTSQSHVPTPPKCTWEFLQHSYNQLIYVTRWPLKCPAWLQIPFSLALWTKIVCTSGGLIPPWPDVPLGNSARGRRGLALGPEEARGITFEVLDGEHLLLGALLLAEDRGLLAHAVGCGYRGEVGHFLTLHDVTLSADLLLQVRAVRRARWKPFSLSVWNALTAHKGWRRPRGRHHHPLRPHNSLFGDSGRDSNVLRSPPRSSARPTHQGSPPGHVWSRKPGQTKDSGRKEGEMQSPCESRTARPIPFLRDFADGFSLRIPSQWSLCPTTVRVTRRPELATSMLA